MPAAISGGTCASAAPEIEIKRIVAAKRCDFMVTSRVPKFSPSYRDVLCEARASALDQLSAKRTVALQMPLAAHGLPARRIRFGVKQRPNPAARRAGARARIVPGNASIEIERPPDIGAMPAIAVAAEDVDEALHVDDLAQANGRDVSIRRSSDLDVEDAIDEQAHPLRDWPDQKILRQLLIEIFRHI